MAVKIKIQHPNFPSGKELSVQGLPPLPNNRTITVSDEEEQHFEAVTGTKLKDAFSSSEMITVERVVNNDKS